MALILIDKLLERQPMRSSHFERLQPLPFGRGATCRWLRWQRSSLVQGAELRITYIELTILDILPAAAISAKLNAGYRPHPLQYTRKCQNSHSHSSNPPPSFLPITQLTSPQHRWRPPTQLHPPSPRPPRPLLPPNQPHPLHPPHQRRRKNRIRPRRRTQPTSLHPPKHRYVRPKPHPIHRTRQRRGTIQGQMCPSHRWRWGRMSSGGREVRVCYTLITSLNKS